MAEQGNENAHEAMRQLGREAVHTMDAVRNAAHKVNTAADDLTAVATLVGTLLAVLITGYIVRDAWAAWRS